jgi:hypothetical protein
MSRWALQRFILLVGLCSNGCTAGRISPGFRLAPPVSIATPLAPAPRQILYPPVIRQRHLP